MLKRGVILSVLSLFWPVLTGCGVGTAFIPASPHQLGSVHGGQQPVSGATIQLYSVGNAGDGSPSQPLLTSAVKSDENGSFDITGLYSCPSTDSLVYITASGGNPGLVNGTTNDQLALLAALGQCGSLSSATVVNVNELTTVAAVSSLSPFLTSLSSIGASPTHATELLAAFNLSTQLVNTATGTAQTSNGTSLPVGKLNTLGDILASCVNSAGGVAGDGTPCGTLEDLTTSYGNTPATNTVTAMLAIALQPTLHVEELFELSPASSPFQPALKTAPADYSLSLSLPTFQTGPGSSFLVLGDSHAAGYGLDPAVRYSTLVAGTRQWTENNVAYTGDTLMDLTQRMPWSQPITNSTVTLLNEGSNDVTVLCWIEGGTCSGLTALHQQFVEAEYRAWTAWVGSSDARKTYAQACSLTGSWLATNQAGLPGSGRISKTVGDSASCDVYGTRADVIVVATSGQGGTYSLTVDDGLPLLCGYPTGTAVCSAYTDVSGHNGGTLGLVSTAVSNLSPGWHSVKMTVTGTGGVGLLGIVGSTVAESKPLVLASYATRFGLNSGVWNAHNDAYVTAFQGYEGIVFTEMQNAGFNLLTSNYSVPGVAGEWWDPNDPTETQSDSVHPNALGDSYIAALMLATLSGH